MSVLSIRRLRFFLLAFVWAAPAVVADTVLITGANSGIGLEFAKQYAADGWQVIATHRRNSTPASLAELKAEYDNVRIETIDVTNSAMIAAAAPTSCSATSLQIFSSAARSLSMRGEPKKR